MSMVMWSRAVWSSSHLAGAPIRLSWKERYGQGKDIATSLDRFIAANGDLTPTRQLGTGDGNLCV